MSMKFSFLIDVDIWKRVASSNSKTEVARSRNGHQLEIVYDVIISTRIWPDLGEIWKFDTE